MQKNKDHNMVKRQAANDFVIWRAGSSVNWDCSIAELIKETGLQPPTVREACKRRGWELVNANGRKSERLGVDVMFSVYGGA